MEYPEPFAAPLKDGPTAFNGDLRRLENSDDYVVRVEPYSGFEDLVGHTRAHKHFEEISGLHVVPYWDVIGETDPPERLIDVNYHDDSRFRAVFHVAQNVTSEVSRVDVSEFDFPPDIALQMIEGLTEYYIVTFERGLPYSYEIRPGQFMYGKVKNDTEPKLYMVDVDYALDKCETVRDLIWNLDNNMVFINEYSPNSLFRPVVERILEYITTNPNIKQWYQENPSTEEESIERLEASLKNYLKPPVATEV